MEVQGIICFHVGVNIPLMISRCVGNLCYFIFVFFFTPDLLSSFLYIMVYTEKVYFRPIHLESCFFNYYSFPLGRKYNVMCARILVISAVLAFRIWVQGKFLVTAVASQAIWDL